jgi:hypothetical protein
MDGLEFIAGIHVHTWWCFSLAGLMLARRRCQS